MTHRHPRPTTSPRHHRLLLATLLVAAISVAGCGVSASGSRGITQMRADDERPAADLPSPPRRDVPRTISNLDPALRAAVRAAQRDAQKDGVAIQVTSGWRSRAHQERLYDEAVSTYGSEEEARRYVSTPDASAHVSGDAVDIGPAEAQEWLARHGAAYGLCQVFANEAWHFELATTAGGSCPELLPDSSWRS